MKESHVMRQMMRCNRMRGKEVLWGEGKGSGGFKCYDLVSEEW